MKTSEWNGQTNYECEACPFSSLSEPRFHEHRRKTCPNDYCPGKPEVAPVSGILDPKGKPIAERELTASEKKKRRNKASPEIVEAATAAVEEAVDDALSGE